MECAALLTNVGAKTIVNDLGIGLAEQDVDHIRSAGGMYLRHAAHHQPIYQWMKDYGLGESAYGKLMDAVGRRKGVFDHRHFGHHVVYDFPFGNLDNAPDFIEHLLISDFFTKQGIPIIPGEFLESSGIREFCKVQTLRWNFVNAFDLLAGTLAIYDGCRNIKTYWNGDNSIESFAELAKQLGVGTTELAIAVSTQNPFLLIGAALHLAGTTKGILTSPSKAYFRKILGQYVLVVAPVDFSIGKCWEEYELSVERSWKGYSPHEVLAAYKLKV